MNYYFLVIWVLVQLLCSSALGDATAAPTEAPLPDPVYSLLTLNCTCIQARAYYQLIRPDTLLYDPTFHYDQWNKDGSWNCAVCAVDPIFVTDPRAQCDAAKQNFASINNVSLDDAFAYYYTNFMSAPMLLWHYELCPDVLPPSANQPAIETVGLTEACTCLEARLDYWARYPDVLAGDFEPLFHYVMYHPSNAALTWNCNLCNATSLYINSTFCQTCAPAISNFTSTAPVAKTAYNPFLFYYDFYGVDPHLIFHCEYCPYTPPPVVTTGAIVGTTGTTSPSSTTSSNTNSTNSSSTPTPSPTLSPTLTPTEPAQLSSDSSSISSFTPLFIFFVFLGLALFA